MHALDVYHTLDLADASSSGESRPGPQAVTPPSVFHPREPSVRCWRPSRSIQTTGQLLPSSPEASQCSRASRSDFQNLTPTTSPCLPTPGRRCLILTGNVLRVGSRVQTAVDGSRASSRPNHNVLRVAIGSKDPRRRQGGPYHRLLGLGWATKIALFRPRTLTFLLNPVWYGCPYVLGARWDRVMWIFGD